MGFKNPDLQTSTVLTMYTKYTYTDQKFNKSVGFQASVLRPDLKFAAQPQDIRIYLVYLAHLTLVHPPHTPLIKLMNQVFIHIPGPCMYPEWVFTTRIER